MIFDLPTYDSTVVPIVRGFALRWGDEGQHVRVFMEAPTEAAIVARWSQLDEAEPDGTLVYLLREAVEPASLCAPDAHLHPAVVDVCLLGLGGGM